MKKIINVIFSAALFLCMTSLLGSCVNSDKNAKNEFPVQLNYNEDYPEKDIDLKEIADIEYVAFRGKDVIFDSGVGVSGISISDEYIVLSNWNEGTVFVFDRSGNLINKFNRKGRGRNEYQHISELAADFKNREIFLFDIWSKHKVLVYSFEGEFKRSFKTPNLLWIERVVDYNNESLLGHFKTSPTITDQSPDNIFNYFISKKDGKHTPISNIVPKEVVSSSVMIQQTESEDGMVYTTTFGIRQACAIFKNSSETLVSDFGCDTIYIDKGDQQFSPFIVKSPPIVNSDEPTLVFVELKTKKYTFVEKVVRSQIDKQIKKFGIDNYTGEIFEPNIIFSDDENGISLHSLYSNPPENYAVALCPISRYFERDEKGELKGELKEFISTLDEEDNDFLRIIKFKD